MLRRRLDYLIARIEGLQDNFSTALAAAGASCHLGEHLEDAFPREWIWQVQADICEDDANKSHEGKVESFGKHLGADQHIGAMRSEVSQDHFMGMFFTCRFPALILISGDCKGNEVKSEEWNLDGSWFRGSVPASKEKAIHETHEITK